MILTPLDLDGDMDAAQVLRRLARHGIWKDASHWAVRERLEAMSLRMALNDSQAQDAMAAWAEALHREPDAFGAAIRWRRGAMVSWHARGAAEVLTRCLAAPPDAVLHGLMNLARDRDASPIVLTDGEDTALRTGVLMQDGWPIGVSMVPPSPFDAISHMPRPQAEPVRRGETTSASMAEPMVTPMSAPMAAHGGPPASVAKGEGQTVSAWPWLDGPETCRAGIAFELLVGLADRPLPGATGAMHLRAEPGQDWIDVTVILMAGQGVAAPDGWQRDLRVMVDDPCSARVSFKLVGLDPTGPCGNWLTMLEVRYVCQGTVCGSAARPLLVLPRESMADRPLPMPAKAALLAPEESEKESVEEPRPAPVMPPAAMVRGASPMQATTMPVALAPDAAPPDLTIEFAKPDRDPSQGRYVCRLYSHHALSTPAGPFEMDLGDDARTFARQMAEELRLHADDALLDLAMESNGRLVASRLPPQVMQAVREVAAKAGTAVPSVLIVSAEHHVPWELAWMDEPLDPARPAYLGAQVLLGRWLRSDMPMAAAQGMMPASSPRPALHPPAAMAMRHLAVMAAWYQAESGLRRLPMAEDEAGTLAHAFGALALEASTDSLRQMLTATLRNKAGETVPPDAVHFAGHGEFDPARPEASALFLGDGKPMSAKLFRAAKYGGAHQPLLFLNACMLGIGGDLLGAAGGFPGHSLHGGFGAVLAALWEIDDQVAHDVALAFWRRAMPTAEGPGEPIAAILRDLRGRYADDACAGRGTYLAYVYYGHPLLRFHAQPPVPTAAAALAASASAQRSAP